MSLTESYTLLSPSRLTEMMHNAGVRPSVQRIAVLSHIANLRRHPTADEIYTDLVEEFPSMSRTTVYNSLHALTSGRLVKELEIAATVTTTLRCSLLTDILYVADVGE